MEKTAYAEAEKIGAEAAKRAYCHKAFPEKKSQGDQDVQESYRRPEEMGACHQNCRPHEHGVFGHAAAEEMETKERTEATAEEAEAKHELQTKENKFCQVSKSMPLMQV